MTIKEVLTAKAEEVADLYSRGLLTVFYNAAWEDVMKIVDRYKEPKEVKPIHLVAHENCAVVRFAADQRGIWQGSIRPMVNKADAHMVSGKTYYNCEEEVRKYFRQHGKDGWISPFINKAVK